MPKSAFNPISFLRQRKPVLDGAGLIKGYPHSIFTFLVNICTGYMS